MTREPEDQNPTETALRARLEQLQARLKASEVELVTASAIEPEAIDWLWDGWLARGKLHLLAGSVGAGKTTLALSLAATISRGGEFPDGAHAPLGDTLFWSGEDEAANALVPRFLACGGDPDRLHFENGVRHRSGEVVEFDPARDLGALARAMEKRPDLALLVVDPIASAVAGDSDKSATVRRSLGAMVRLAAARKIAVLGIGHFGKTRRSHEPTHRVLGAPPFIAMARVVMATGKAADGSRLLVRTKSNIGPDHDGFAYTLDREEVSPGVMGQKIVWQTPVYGSAADLLRDAEMDVLPPVMKAAQEWLITQLGTDGARVDELMTAAALAGHSWITVLRARRSLRIKSVRLGRSGSIWALPSSEVPAAGK